MLTISTPNNPGSSLVVTMSNLISSARKYYAISSATLFIAVLASSNATLAASLASFEPGDAEVYSGATDEFVLRTTDGYKWDAYNSGSSFAPSWGYLEIDNTQGALNTSSSLKLTVTGGRTNPYVKPEETCGNSVPSKQDAIDNPSDICNGAGGGFNYWFLNSDRSKGVPLVNGANRISFYAKIPNGFNRKMRSNGDPGNYTLHFGTYTRDPDGSYSSSSNLGRHFYHWLNFKGTGIYWTKIIIDEHPQHEVGKSGQDPGDNPTAPSSSTGFNYIEGITRFYFKTKSYLFQNPWSAWIDEFQIYNDPRPMPPKVATIAITQVAPSDFEIDFASTDEGGGDNYVNTYEVRYSMFPINAANYASATIVSGSPAVTGDYERYAHCNAYGLNLNGKSKIYFAIQQTDENTGAIAYAEYEFQPQGLQPKAPTDVVISVQ